MTILLTQYEQEYGTLSAEITSDICILIKGNFLHVANIDFNRSLSFFCNYVLTIKLTRQAL